MAGGAAQAERRARTRRRLVAAGVRVVGDKGLAATTVADVAHAAGLSSGTFYNYFPTREDLFDAVAARIDELARQEQAALPEGDPTTRLRALVGRLDDALATSPGAVRAVVELTTHHAGFRARSEATIAALLAEGARRGDYRFGSLSAATTFALGVLLEGLRRGGIEPDLVELLLTGLGAEAPVG